MSLLRQWINTFFNSFLIVDDTVCFCGHCRSGSSLTRHCQRQLLEVACRLLMLQCGICQSLCPKPSIPNRHKIDRKYGIMQVLCRLISVFASEFAFIKIDIRHCRYNTKFHTLDLHFR